MKLFPSIFQARLESFSKKTKSRRSSTRSKKTTSAATSWPLKSPKPSDLAFAGFSWNPTSASPDNVQCFLCSCNLDGWESTDVPAYEHLTHSPDCGFAINIHIRLGEGDPNRVLEDPLNDKMMKARRDTYANNWPLDSNAGFPSVEQMVEAGWYYDPSPDGPDGVTCPYCSLSLDAWEAGDDPLAEHKKRSGGTCVFFELKEVYHPADIPYTQQSQKTTGRGRSTAAEVSKPAPKGKRASRSSSKPPAPKKKAPAKATRAKKVSNANTDTSSRLSTISKVSRGTKRSSAAVEDDYQDAVIRETRANKKAKRDSLESSNPAEISSFPSDLPMGTPNQAPNTPETPEKVQVQAEWEPVDLSAFVFRELGIVSTADLTEEEKAMTIEEFLLWEAKKKEGVLRDSCMQQITALEAEFNRAMVAIDAM